MSIPLNEIIQGDCLEVMKSFPDECIDLVVTSPPYNCGIDYDSWDDCLPWDEYISWCESWLSEIKRVLKSDGGRLCLNVLLEMGIENNKKRVSPYAEFYKLFNDLGIKPYGSPVWVDNHRVKYTAWGSWLKSTSPYIYCPYEVVMIGYKDVWKKTGAKTDISKEDFMMGCSGIWDIKTQTKQTTKANFHEDLPSLCIKLLSGYNDIVLDPFSGSGTTCKMAKANNRNYIGIDISEEYCEIARKRIAEHSQQLTIDFEEEVEA